MKKTCMLVVMICLAGCSQNSVEQKKFVSIEQMGTPVVTKPTYRPTPQATAQHVQERKSPKRFGVKFNAKLTRRYEIVRVENSSLKAMTKPLSSYSLDEVKNLPMNVRKTYRVVVPADIKEKQVRPTVEKIISKIIEGNNEIDEIALFLYSDKRVASGAYDVASATWAPNGEWGSTTPEIASTNDRTGYSIVVEVKPDLEAYLKQKNTPEKAFGLSDEERRGIYKMIVASEDKAQAQADEKYSTDADQPGWLDNVGKNNQMRDDLKDKYRSQIAKKHHLSVSQIWDIVNEGVQKNWPVD